MRKSLIRVAILAPIPALRAGLRTLLNDEPEDRPEIRVVFEAASWDDFRAYAPAVDVLVLVGGEAVPVGAALRARVRQLISATPEDEGRLALLLLTDDAQAAYSLAGLPLRAWGVLPLDAGAGELQAALGALDEGLLVGAPVLLELLLERRSGQQITHLVGEEAEDGGEIDLALTGREGQVLQLLARGLANKQIAAQLNISEHTVKFHVSSIYTKLGVTNRAEAVRVGVQRGLILL